MKKSKKLLFQVLSILFIVVCTGTLHAQVQIFAGENPNDATIPIVERVGNWGPEVNSQAGNSCNFNRARGVISLGTEIQSDGYASWDYLTVHFYYNGQWVKVLETRHRDRGTTTNGVVESSVSNTPSDVTVSNCGIYNPQSTTNYAYDGTMGTDWRCVHQSHSDGNADRENNIYLRNWNNLKLYNFSYLPVASTTAVRTNNSVTSNWSLQFDKYASAYNYPVRNGNTPASNTPAGYDIGNSNSAGNVDGIHYVQYTTEWGLLILSISNLPPEMISSPSFKVRVYAHHDAGTKNKLYITTYNNANPLQNAPTGLTASQNDCSGAILSWSNSSNPLPEEAPMTLKNVIFRNGVYLAEVGPNVTSYTDATAVQNVVYQYSVRHIAYTELGKTYFQSNPSNIAEGQRKPTPDIAVSPIASENRCAAEIEVKWQYNQSNPSFFRIDRATSVGGPYTTLTSTLAGTERLYLDNTVTRGVRYYYRIYSINNCGVLSLGAASVSGTSIAIPATATGVTATYNAGTGFADVAWTDVANNETEYEVIRQDDLGNTVFFNVNQNGNSFTDDGVSTCRQYTYKIKVYNECVTAGLISPIQPSVVIPPPNISTTFDATHKVTGSKGYFTNRVELSYNANNPQNLDQIKIYRKILGTTDSTLIAAVNPSSGLYVDNTADARVYYEYSLIGERNCNGSVLYTNITKDIGFRNPLGTIAGHVEFTGGIAVQDVKVVATPSAGDVGYSLSFNNGTATAQDLPTIEPGGQLRLDFWIKPMSATNGSIINKGSAFGFARNGANYEVSLNSGTPVTLTFPATVLPVGTWKPVSIQYNGSSVFVLVNGVQVAQQTYSGAILNNASNLVVGNAAGPAFKMDELRLMSVAADSATAARDSYRYLNGNEAGFKISLHFDEGVGQSAYDVSKQSNVYNANHISLSATGVSWDVDRPSNAELSYTAYTDNLGNYIVSGIRYNGSGDNFVVVPSKGVHQFSPGSRSIYIGDLSQVFNNQDFTDISSFLTTGTVRYYNPNGTPTNCYVPAAGLYIDGQPVVKNGQQVVTDATGYFEIQVPIGNHIVATAKFQHTFSDSSFTNDFQQPVSGLEFRDTTTRIVTGRVVGGTVEAAKVPGLGRSVNNLGKAKIRFVSPITATTPAMACYYKEIVTDSLTGEYTVALPPLQYKVDTLYLVANPSALLPTGLSTNIGATFNMVNYSAPTPVSDTLFDSNGAFVTVDSMSYTKRLDFIYRVTPQVNFTDTLGNKFIGEDSLTFAGTTFPINNNLATTWGDFGWPVFLQGRTYYGDLHANEYYTNLDNLNIDTVPLKGNVNFTNDLINGADPTPTVPLVGGKARYSFVAGDPNNATGSPAAFNYTLPLQIVVVPFGAPSVTWKPNAGSFPSNPEYRAYVLGSKITGTGVATLGPERVDFILRDPAGSGSSSTWSTGTSVTRGSTFSLSSAATAATSVEVKTGFQQSVGIGVETEVDIEVEAGVGLESSATTSSGGGFSETMTSSASVSTRDDADNVGADADIFIGRSRNWLVGPTSNIELIDAGQCSGSVICFGPNVGGKRLSKKLGYAIQPSTVKTRFSYTQSEIENVVIPTLEALRNTKLVAPTYTNILPASDPRYGANNDDPIFGAAVTTTTPFVYEAADKTGPSYTFTGTVMDNDTVRTINQQIALWKQALARNEREKWQAINNTGGVLIDNFTLGSAIVTNSYEVNNGAEYTTEWELSTSIDQKLAISAEAGGSGASMEQTLAISETIGGSRGTSTETTTAFEYTLTDGDDGDIFSIDVYKSSEGTGNIFVTRGGRSMCPYEDAVQPHYFDPMNPNKPITSHSYIANPTATIQLATVQREMPNIVITPSQQFNIPSDQQAVYQLILTNQSPEVVNNDIDMRVRVASQSNPNGAIVKIDGLDPNTYYTIPAGANVVKTLTVERGPIYIDYDSLMIIFSSACSEDIADTAYISVHFIPTCTDLDFMNPTNNWIVNADSQNELMVRINDYNYNYGAASVDTGAGVMNLGLNKIGFEMKQSTSSSWLPLELFYKYPSSAADSVIPTNNYFIQYPWDVSSIPDGSYELRAKSYCLNYDGSLSEVASPVYAGIMDRIKPHPFGVPSPGDGILDPNDNISIQFNEPLDLGSMGWPNFQVRGVLNGTDLRHAEFVNFDGSDYVEVPGGVGLQGKDFTVEFWARPIATATEQVLVSQGIDPNESMAIGFDASNKLKFTINGQTVVSNAALSGFTTWNHYAVVYDYDDNKGFLYQNGNLVNAGNLDILANYNGSGKMYFGKQMPSGSNFYNGHMHEVRVWNKQRNSGEIVQDFNKVLSVNSSGLVHNWQMDEAEGTIIEDQIRQRNAVMVGAEWQVDPNGFAADFDGTDDYLKVKASSIPITTTMDATIEFWFNSTSTAAGTLFSSGKGDGVGSDSLTGIEINKDAAGRIHVLQNGLDFIAVDSNYFDGLWHHFALVLNRNANLSAYIDGNLKNGVQAINFNAIAGPFYTVGARGYVASGGNYVQDQHYTGKLDEVRVWNVARKLEQVKRDIHNRLKGDEFGLLAYAPFESYAIVLNVPVLTASISNQATAHVNDTIWGMNGLTTIVQTPVVKIPRPVENVNFTWSLNNDQIIVTPTTAPELLENQTIDITVQNVFDLHGNQMESPKTWIAYFNKNQVFWADDVMEFDIAEDSLLQFTATILNTGGALKQWTLSGIPSWMTTSSTSGSIAPNSSQNITFTVPAGINVGEYYADIALTTDFNYDELLRVSVKVHGTPPNWTLNPNNFQYAMSVIGEIELDGVINGNTETMIAGFMHDSIVALGHLQYVPSYDRYEVFLNLLSNQQIGDSITFQIYDANTGRVYVDVTPSIFFVDGDLLGTLSNPITFSSSLTMEKLMPLNTGWTWISLPLSSNDQGSTNALFDDVSATNGDVVKGIASYDQFDAATTWIGSISNNGGYANFASYKVRLNAADTLRLVGQKIHPDSSYAAIQIVPGYNWIGYISMKNLSVNEALGNYPAMNGDLIRSQYEFAYYDSINAQWTGSLTVMRPGMGYVLKSAQNTTFHYPISAFLRPADLPKQLTPFYTMNANAFEQSMSVVVKSNLCIENMSDNMVLGAFNANNELRGWIPAQMDVVSGKPFYYLTIHGNTSGETLNLKFFNNTTGAIIPTAVSLPFEQDAFYGTTVQPVIANVSMNYACRIEAGSETVEAESTFTVEPNPFNEEFAVNFTLKQSGTIELLDAQSKIIYTATLKDANHFVVDTNKAFSQLANGVYMLRVTYDNGTIEQQRLLKVTK